MYYKIENKECEAYKKLHKMRTKELKFEEENKAIITEKTGLEWNRFLGHDGQQQWNRVTTYSGFEFISPEKVDLKIWTESKQYSGIYVPNRRTKAGREMVELLNNGLRGHRFDIVFDILKIEHKPRFTFPFVEICNETIVMYFGEDYNIKSDDIIEITKSEFGKISDAV